MELKIKEIKELGLEKSDLAKVVKLLKVVKGKFSIKKYSTQIIVETEVKGYGECAIYYFKLNGEFISVNYFGE